MGSGARCSCVATTGRCLSVRSPTTIAPPGFVATKPGGAIVVGDLTLKHRPVVATHEHLAPDPIELTSVIQRHGAEVSAMISASDADYERYASHHRHATLR